MSKSLGDFIQDRTESIDAEMITEYFIEKDKDKSMKSQTALQKQQRQTS